MEAMEKVAEERDQEILNIGAGRVRAQQGAGRGVLTRPVRPCVLQLGQSRT